jgi:cobalt-zinc-cadmium efflux system membrane fusion protein
MKSLIRTALLIALAFTVGCAKTTSADVEKAAETQEKSAASSEAAPAGEGICAEHGVLEAVCTKCNPVLAAVFQAKGDWCAEHGFPESLCPRCHPERGGKPSVDVQDDGSPADGQKIRLKSSDTARLAGIETVAAAKGRRISETAVPVKITYDANRLAIVNARTPGVVKKLGADIGAWVAAGDHLALIESAMVSADQSRLASAKSRFELAESRLRRESELEKKGISSRYEVETAAQELQEARAEYNVLASSLGVIKAEGGSEGRYSLTAPFSGVVTQRNVSVNQYVDSEETLFEIVDTSSMWAELAIPEAELGQARKGSRVTLKFDGLPGREFQGTIDNIDPVLDPQTRTAKARVRLSNPSGLLKVNMYGKALITVSGSKGAALVPRSAIQRAKSVQLVFVRTAPDEYETRRVRTLPGGWDSEYVDVASGIEPGEEIVTAGSFFLKTETLKDSIGAGCCDVDNK